jgi:hypothetical protein
MRWVLGSGIPSSDVHELLGIFMRLNMGHLHDMVWAVLGIRGLSIPIMNTRYYDNSLHPQN